jgi:hypothetical protein
VCHLQCPTRSHQHPHEKEVCHQLTCILTTTLAHAVFCIPVYSRVGATLLESLFNNAQMSAPIQSPWLTSAICSARPARTALCTCGIIISSTARVARAAKSSSDSPSVKCSPGRGMGYLPSLMYCESDLEILSSGKYHGFPSATPRFFSFTDSIVKSCGGCGAGWAARTNAAVVAARLRGEA